MGKKTKSIDKESFGNMASDILTDVLYSFTTDLIKNLHEDGNIQDVDLAIATVIRTAEEISIHGLKLRKANIERRTMSKKKTVQEIIGVEKEDVSWTKYSKNKKLEYTTDFDIYGKYPLKKRKEDVVVGLLTMEQLEDDEWEDTGKYKIGSKEKEKLFSMGFIPDDKK